jgi:hypothetical protein
VLLSFRTFSSSNYNNKNERKIKPGWRKLDATLFWLTAKKMKIASRISRKLTSLYKEADISSEIAIDNTFDASRN